MAVKDAVKAEATPTEVSFKYDGEDYTVPAPKVWPLEVIEAQESGKFATCVRALLGENQYLKFKRTPRTLSDLEQLTDAMFSAVNANQGE